jgi:hypothetical protein
MIRPIESHSLKKAVLKNTNGGNYHPTCDFKERIYDSIKTEAEEVFGWCSGGGHTNSCGGGNGSSGSLVNNWYRHFFHYIHKMIDEVTVIEKVANDQYDRLLTNNILFIHLVDCSTANTILEAIVRNTPILVNRHPAVVELLGAKYPLYYDSVDASPFIINAQIHALLSNPNAIFEASRYLSSLDKSVFSISHFVEQFTKHVQASIPAPF